MASFEIAWTETRLYQLARTLTHPFRRYAAWLHTQWPGGEVEKLPKILDDDGRADLPGVFIVGDLTGIPLLKLSAETGARAVRAIADDDAFAKARRARAEGVRELAIVGAGVSGMSAALEAKRLGVDFEVIEAKRRFQTIEDFPKRKPIYTYPQDMEPEAPLHFRADVKEDLLDELERQTDEIEVTDGDVQSIARGSDALELRLADGGAVRALRVIVAIGRSGNYRTLDVPGETLDHVYHRLHDPADFADRKVLVVGGGDSAVETAIALAEKGAEVTLSYRRPELSRPKPDNVEKLETLKTEGEAPEPGRVRALFSTEVRRIATDRATLAATDDGDREIEVRADVVFSMIGREAPLDFFRRSGISIEGEWSAAKVAGLVGFVTFCLWLYHWKAPYAIPFGWTLPDWLAPDPAGLWEGLASIGDRIRERSEDPSTLLGTLRISASKGAFYYTLAYSVIVVVFGVRRIRYRETPYITVQTATLMAIQVLPLFVLPEILLPWAGHNGWFEAGWGKTVADGLFPAVDYDHGREYWRAYGFILAWPLMVWNWFTAQPLAWWLVLGCLQTFVVIPLIVYRWGKGAYCGWICSCGALAETLGDRHRHKMPHGPFWNRLNLLGQVILVAALALMGLRIAGWAMGDGSWAAGLFSTLHTGSSESWTSVFNYHWLVDLMLAGVLGYGLYFWFSGRMWCRFACPLAALMHIYHRFGQFRILADKKKCISCNVCTTVCHQGIDVMSFANKGRPMADPECVRCSACVQSCPTGVLTFGRVDRDGRVIGTDRLAASPVQMREG